MKIQGISAGRLRFVELAFVCVAIAWMSTLTVPKAGSAAETCPTNTPGHLQPTAPRVPGVDIQIVRPGQGQPIGQGDWAEVEATIWLDGFDGQRRLSEDAGKRFVVPVGIGQALPGLECGIVGMKPGEVRRLKVSPEMGYGSNPRGSAVPANSTLYFEVHYLKLAEFTKP